MCEFRGYQVRMEKRSLRESSKVALVAECLQLNYNAIKQILPVETTTMHMRGRALGPFESVALPQKHGDRTIDAPPNVLLSGSLSPLLGLCGESTESSHARRPHQTSVLYLFVCAIVTT